MEHSLPNFLFPDKKGRQETINKQTETEEMKNSEWTTQDKLYSTPDETKINL